MSQAMPPPDKVAFEWLGMARAFRSKIDSTDERVNETIESVGVYASEIIHRRYNFRYEQLQHIERTLRLGLPENGRIGYTFDLNKRQGSLVVADIRLVAGSFRRLDWLDEEWEQSLSLLIIDARFNSGKMRIRNHPIAAISLHSLARRFQRSFDQSDKATYRDLSEIALNATKLIKTKEFRQPAGDGEWCGSTILAEHQDLARKILAVRTFI